MSYSYTQRKKNIKKGLTEPGKKNKKKMIN